MPKQISLFNQQPKAKAKPKKLTSYDKLCRKLTKNGLDTHLHLFSAKKAQNILLWYITDSNFIGEYKEKLCKMSKQIKPGRFYHMIITKEGIKLLSYNNWLTGMVLKSETK